MICTTDQHLHNEEFVIISSLLGCQTTSSGLTTCRILNCRVLGWQKGNEFASTDHLTVEVVAATITGFSLRGTIMKPLTGSVRQSSAQNDAIRRICAITRNLAGEDAVSIFAEE